MRVAPARQQRIEPEGHEHHHQAVERGDRQGQQQRRREARVGANGLPGLARRAQPVGGGHQPSGYCCCWVSGAWRPGPWSPVSSTTPSAISTTMPMSQITFCQLAVR